MPLSTARWHCCREEGCSYKSTRVSHLKQHLASKHNIGVVWQACTEPGCEYKGKRACHLKQHMAEVHNKGVVWCACEEAGCGYKGKRACHLKQHMAEVHNKGVVWHACTEADCEYKGKRACHLKQHMAEVHGHGVTWHACGEDGCTFKAKKGSHLKAHLENVHDIGKHTCDYCCRNRNSRIAYTDANAGCVHICRACFRKSTGKDSRIELVWSSYVDQELGTDFLLSSDKSLRSLGGCSKRRPDKLYASSDCIEIDECDEHQHTRSGSGDYTCEERRLTEIYDEPSLCGKRMVVVRWNPDAYKVGDGEKRLSRKERLRLFVALKKKLRARSNDENTPRIEIFYMFYDRDNPHICQNISHTFVNLESDIQSL